jgi:hypothetical protein
MESRQVWSAPRDTPGSLAWEPSHPGRGARKQGNANQGYRSLRSLNPWLYSYHPSGVTAFTDSPRILIIWSICASVVTNGGARQ